MVSCVTSVELIV